MALTQLIFRKRNIIGTVEFDAVINEGARSRSRVTENPVEDGANTNDHIIIEPAEFFLEGVVSETPSSLSDQFQRSSIFTTQNARTSQKWEELLKLQTDKTPFTLVQGLLSYPNVVILSLSTSQNAETANALFFTAQMREFIFVGAERPTAEQFNEPNIADKMLSTIQGGIKQLLS